VPKQIADRPFWVIKPFQNHLKASCKVMHVPFFPSPANEIFKSIFDRKLQAVAAASASTDVIPEFKPPFLDTTVVVIMSTAVSFWA
jgi:hypothetical protein